MPFYSVSVHGSVVLHAEMLKNCLCEFILHDHDQHLLLKLMYYVQEAMLMGIPSSAVPELRRDASLEELQLARERLSGMIASFLSSGL